METKELLETIFDEINSLRQPIQAPESGAASIEQISYNKALSDVQELIRIKEKMIEEKEAQQTSSV